MRLLLDTQVFIWAAIDSPRLTMETRSVIREAEATFVSAASIWEIAIKARLGKLDADPAEMIAAIEGSGFLELPISAIHSAGVRDLPAHHNDPFDHLLLAQAIAEPLRLMTADPLLPRYSELVLLV
ncbi:MAG TPA: type II toxin-antitoxin system VapC family toxin [Longimicrobiaceae bacterium]|nr:type II toxin-antitoxin system VapC family toxin [Longimicrobiaceae bacterium]